jgi:hypothetical protein
MSHRPRFVEEAMQRLQTYCDRKGFAFAMRAQRIRPLQKVWRIWVVVPAWKTLRQSSRQALAEKIMSGEGGVVSRPGTFIFVHVLPHDWFEKVNDKKYVFRKWQK